MYTGVESNSCRRVGVISVSSTIDPPPFRIVSYLDSMLARCGGGAVDATVFMLPRLGGRLREEPGRDPGWEWMGGGGEKGFSCDMSSGSLYMSLGRECFCRSRYRKSSETSRPRKSGRATPMPTPAI